MSMNVNGTGSGSVIRTLRVSWNGKLATFKYGKSYAASKSNMVLTAAAGLELMNATPGADAPPLETLRRKMVVVSANGQFINTTLGQLLDDICTILDGKGEDLEELLDGGAIHVLKGIPTAAKKKVRQCRQKPADTVQVRLHQTCASM